MKTRKEHDAEIRWALNACADAAKSLWDAQQSLWDAQQRSQQAQYRLDSALEALMNDYQKATEVKP